MLGICWVLGGDQGLDLPCWPISATIR
jgi:hypothetical protein